MRRIAYMGSKVGEMTEKDWEKIQYFSPSENWGNPYKMKQTIVFRLDAFRKTLNRPIIIHCGYETKGHASNSFHYLGLAVDIHIAGLNLLDQFLEAEKFGFYGIGVYPYWNTPGLHLDMRNEIARWWRTKDGIYKKLTSEAFLRRGDEKWLKK